MAVHRGLRNIKKNLFEKNIKSAGLNKSYWYDAELQGNTNISGINHFLLKIVQSHIVILGNLGHCVWG